MPYRIENDACRLEFDELSGAVSKILFKSSQLNIIANRRLAANFKLLVPLPELRNNYLIGSKQKLSHFNCDNNSCTLTWETITNTNGSFQIRVQQRYELGPEANEILIATTVKNETSFTIEEIWSPIVGGFHGIRDRMKTEFTAALWDGTAAPNNGKYPLARFPSSFPYWNEYYDYFEIAYPWELSMQWVDFTNRETHEGLYFASHDISPQVTFFHFELQPGMVQRGKLDRWPSRAEAGQRTPEGVNCSVVKLPFVKPSESWTSAPVCIHFHGGDWHVAADRYRRWIDTWMTIAPKPEWAKDNMTWETLVFGYPDDLILYKFSDIPKLAREAVKNGINVLNITGFHRGGLDRGYPDYSPDPRQGTKDELHNAIKEANKLGVKVLPFVNIQVADVNTDEFKNELYKWTAKDRFGNQIHIDYGMHTFAEKNRWGSRKLAYMCPSAKPYQDLIVGRFEEVVDLGFNGLEIDKVADYGLCYDENHEHRPGEAFSKGTSETLKRISENCRRHSPDFFISVEAAYPFLWPYANAGFFRLRDWDRSPICRYSFPEIMMTSCIDQFDFQSVNNCLRVGYLMNIEIHNAHGNIRSAPKLGRYLKEIARIRNELGDYLWNGQFRDTVGANLSGETRDVLFGVHIDRKSSKRAVVLMNTGDREKSVKVILKGKKESKHFRIFRPFEKATSQPSSKRINVKAAGVAVAVES